MKTLIDHVENLSKHSTEPKEVILQSILLNELIIDDDSLFSYFIETTPWEKSLTVAWIDGDSKKIKEWVKKAMQENGCKKMRGITLRWKAFQRKYGVKPVGMIMEREAF